MRIRNYTRLRLPMAVLLIGGLTLGVIGMLDLPSAPYLGFKANPEYLVIQVDPHGPAGKAGLRKGDAIVKVAGVPAARPHELNRRLHPKLGEEIEVLVKRDGTPHEINFQPEVQSGRRLALSWIGNLLALVMLGLGFWIFWSRSSKATCLFFLCNLSFALYLMSPPDLESFFLRNLVAANVVLFLTMGLAFFLHLTVTVPKAKTLVAETAILEQLIYVPAPLLAITYLCLRLFLTEADLLINALMHHLFAIMVVAALVLALAAILHSLWKASSAERAQGIWLMFLGSIVGIIPLAGRFLVELYTPQVVLAWRGVLSLADRSDFPLLRRGVLEDGSPPEAGCGW